MDLRGIAALFIVLVIAAWLFGLGPEIKQFFAWLLHIPQLHGRPSQGAVLEMLIKLLFILAVIALLVGAWKKN
jgi:hypothetical protein